MVNFLLVLNELLSLGVMAEALRANIDEYQSLRSIRVSLLRGYKNFGIHFFRFLHNSHV